MILVEDYIAKFFEEKVQLTQQNIDKAFRLLKEAEYELRARAQKIKPLPVEVRLDAVEQRVSNIEREREVVNELLQEQMERQG